MMKQPHASPREIIVANAIKEVVGELRLVDVADYISFIRLEQFGCISDIVDSAAELYFMPGALTLGHGGEVHVSWLEAPRVELDLELRPAGAAVYFTLTLTALHASVEINYVAFDKPDDDPELNTAFLATAVERSRIRPTVSTV